MIELRGSVSKIVSNFWDDVKVFEVSSDKRKYICKYNGFLPIDKGDTISLKGKETDGEIFIIERPFVIIPSNEYNIKCCIMKALKAKGKRITKLKVENFYDELSREHLSPERESKIINYLSDKSEEYSYFSSEVLDEEEVKRLLNWWEKHFNKRRLYLLGLCDSEISQKFTGMSYRTLYSTIKQNPFKVFTVPITKAKDINCIMKKESKKKDIKCGEILRFVFQFTRKGWMACPESLVYRNFPELELYKEYLQDEYNLVINKGLIYTIFSFRIEFDVYERINKMIRLTVPEKKRIESLPDIGNKGYETFPEDNISLTIEQEEALEGSLNSFISIITGGAGCGKTTLIKQIIKNILNTGEKFILASYTGKAVLRIKESIGEEFGKVECMTLDKIITKKKRGGSIKDFDYVIIDEASMISTELMWNFLSQFDHRLKLILIGDCNQLPPIGPGSFFTQLIDSERVPIYYLTQNKRLKKQNGKMTVLKNANGLIDINRNKKIPYEFETDDGFYIIERGVEYCETILGGFKRKGIDHRDVTVLTPFNSNINTIIKYCQSVFLEGKEFRDYNCIKYYLGDRMMQIKNMYTDKFDVMNGEEGEIVEITEDFIVVDYGNKKIDYFICERPEKKKTGEKDESEEIEDYDFYITDIKHSFCKTVHKSQGSEYKYVILYIPRNMSGFLNVNLLYTAITRTKEKIWIVCDRDTLDFATIRYLPARYEKLAERLREAKQEDETIITNTRKKILELEDEYTGLTNDDIWDSDLDIDDLPQEMLDYYNY
jgi:hypothetical protein